MLTFVNLERVVGNKTGATITKLYAVVKTAGVNRHRIMPFFGDGLGVQCIHSARALRVQLKFDCLHVCKHRHTIFLMDVAKDLNFHL